MTPLLGRLLTLNYPIDLNVSIRIHSEDDLTSLIHDCVLTGSIRFSAAV